MVRRPNQPEDLKLNHIYSGKKPGKGSATLNFLEVARELGCNVRASLGKPLFVNATGCLDSNISLCWPESCYADEMLLISRIKSGISSEDMIRESATDVPRCVVVIVSFGGLFWCQVDGIRIGDLA